MKHYDVIIIGGGPAGLTASIYALRSGCSVLLFEGNMLGGQSSTSHAIANYPGIEEISGIDLAMKMHSQAENLGLITEYCAVDSIDCANKTITARNEEFMASCIILAMGAKPKQLGLEKEHKFMSQGVHYCATCDGGFYRGKEVVLVGGGNTAAEDAIYLSNICKKVTMLVRGDKLKCQDILADKLIHLEKQDKIKILYDTTIVDILEQDNKLVGIEFKKAGVNKKITTEAIFVAIGREPDTQLVKDQIKLTREGYVKATEKMHTSVDGVFVAGDIRDKDLRQIITACADGAIAGTEANIYVNNKR